MGALLGAALIAAAGFSSGAPAQQLTTLYTFTGDNGANPGSSLIDDPRAISTARPPGAALAGRVRYSSWTRRGT